MSLKGRWGIWVLWILWPQPLKPLVSSTGARVCPVELVGIELLRTLKTGKLLICRESYKAHKASNACNAGFIVRLLYGEFFRISNCLSSGSRTKVQPRFPFYC